MKPSKAQDQKSKINEQNKISGYGQTRKNGPVTQPIKIAKGC